MKLQQFIQETSNGDSPAFRDRIICKDGFSLSVQGSEFHYCSPKENTDFFIQMEIGFPSEKEDLIMQFIEDYQEPTDSVYPYVPFVIIESVIEKHGGIDVEKTFAKAKLKLT